MGFSGEAAVENALYRVLVNLKNVGEFEDEGGGGGLVAVEGAGAEDAAGEEVEFGDLDDLVWLGEDEVLEFEDFSGFFFDFHVVVVAMVADPVLLFGYGGGLGHGSGRIQVEDDEGDNGF